MKTVLFILSLIISIGLFYSCEEEEQKQESTELSAKILSSGECKSLKGGNNEGCLSFSYNSNTKSLLLNHINAGFNCCPENINADFNFSGDTIIITESQTDGNCDCNCLYDLNMQILNLEPKLWYIRVKEPLLGESEEILFGYMNLENVTEGSFCVARNEYPWGN